MRLLPIVILLLAFVPLVAAGESTEIDFGVARTQPVYLYEGDEVRFDLLGGTHALILENTGDGSVSLDIVPFIGDENTRVGSGYVTFDTVLKIDLDRDGSTDLNVALYSIAEDGRAHLVVQQASEATNEITGDVGVVGSDESGDSTRRTALIALGVMVLLLGGFLYYWNTKTPPAEPTAGVSGTAPPANDGSVGADSSAAQKPSPDPAEEYL